MKSIILSPFKTLIFPLCVTLGISLFSSSINAQIITTIAGAGVSSYSGDGGPATMAGISYPTHTAMDLSGNLYFGDHAECRIRMVNNVGIITTIAGNGTYGFSGDGGPATASANTGPAGVCLDASGNLYFSDYHNNRIRKVNTSGIITTIAGNGTGGYSGDGGPATSAGIYIPWGVVVDAPGNIYISDRYNNRIRKINTIGIISTIAGTGVPGYSGDGGPATMAQINNPVDITIDNSGNVYFSDFYNNCIRKISTSGTITTIAGNGTPGYFGDHGPATAAELNNPIGVSLDSLGNIYVGDYGNNRVRTINTSGIITTIAGTGIAGYSGDGGPATAARLQSPYGVAVYGAGNVYICDAFNYRIRMIHMGNNPPSFIAGHTQSLTVCPSESIPTVSIDSLLAIFDLDAGQTETWSMTTAPSHGTAVVSYSAISTGGTLTPAGLTYSPTIGYTGSDVFSVSVSDGFATDAITINVTISPPPFAGLVSGIDSLCPGDTISLAESSTGGFWSSNNTLISTINSSGTVTGLSPGNDTIIYTVTNPCGTASATFPFIVRSYSDCNTGINKLSNENSETLKIYPNPNNGKFIVNFASNINEQTLFTITNVIGQKVKEFSSLSNKNIEMDLGEAGGIYFVSVVTSHARYISKITVAQ